MAEPLSSTKQTENSSKKQTPSSEWSNIKIYATQPRLTHPAAKSERKQTAVMLQTHRAPRNLNPVRRPRPIRRSDTPDPKWQQSGPEQRGKNQHGSTSNNGKGESRAQQSATGARCQRAAYNTNFKTLLIIKKWVLISTILLCDSTHHNVPPEIRPSTHLTPNYILTQLPPTIWPLNTHPTASTHCSSLHCRLNTHTHRINTQTLDRTSYLLSTPPRSPHFDHPHKATPSSYQQWPPPLHTDAPLAIMSTPSPTHHKHTHTQVSTNTCHYQTNLLPNNTKKSKSYFLKTYLRHRSIAAPRLPTENPHKDISDLNHPH